MSATIAVAAVLAAGFVVAVAVSRWALASVAKARADAEAAKDSTVSMVPFGEMPERDVVAVMATRRRAIVKGEAK